MPFTSLVLARAPIAVASISFNVDYHFLRKSKHTPSSHISNPFCNPALSEAYQCTGDGERHMEYAYDFSRMLYFQARSG